MSIIQVLAGIGQPVDPYYEYTTLLLPGSGTNGAQNNTFLDGSTNNFTITRNGNTTQGTFSPFSQTGWGNYFDGSSTYLQINTTSATLAFSTGDFTIEGWFYFTSTPQVASNPSIISSNNGGFIGWRPTTTGIEVFTPGVGAAVASDAFTIPINQWIHMAVVRESSSMSFYLNGARQGAAKSNTNNYAAPTSEIVIGRTGTGGPVIPGYISNLRVTKGRAVYSGSSYTVPTVPLTRTTGGTNPPQGTECSLLTCQSNRFLDSNGVNVPASSPFTIIANNSPTVVAFSPFNPTASWSAATYGGSGYFDGSGDYLTVPDNASLELGSSSFTIQAWVYVTGLPSSGNLKGIFAKSGSPYGGFYFCINSSGVIKLYASTTGSTWDIANDVGTSTAPLNAWTHIALSRSGSNWRIWVNGASGGTVTSSATIWNTTNSWYICSNGSGAENFTGYLSDASFVIGSTVYDPTSSTITVPTAPLTAITNTSLLLNFTNAGVYDATSKNDLETVADAQISNTTAKWGSTSIKFDGTGDYLITPTANQNFSLGATFTIEFWIYNTKTSGFGGVLGHTGTNWYTGVPITYVSGGASTFTLNSYAGSLSKPGLNNNTWYYVAIVANNNQASLYIDGVLQSGPITQAVTGTPAYFTVGRHDGTNSIGDWSGYIQDLRITKGIARTITTPTAAFPTL